MTTQPTVDFAPFATRMRREGIPEMVIDNFHYYYTALVQGDTGLVPERRIQPVDGLPCLEELSTYAEAGRAALARAAVLKLNGGLGTSMGLDRAKSVLIAHAGLSFLDIIARQNLADRARYGCAIPLIFMNSFNTEVDTHEVLAHYPQLRSDVPESMLQHKVPKVLQGTLRPAEWPADPNLEWCPPGHGEVYIALVISGLLETLLRSDYEYLFISNADNLGATLDLALLGYFARKQVPFLMEVASRTAADRKGGHLARRSDGRLTLREVAQCPAEDLDAFQDIARHRYFNTNNIWVNLQALKALIEEGQNVVKLPLIRNSKTLDPRDPDSPKVYQLETAMGAAIEVFRGAEAVQVPRSRFVPVKTCADLLALRSDIYMLDDDARLQQNPERIGPPITISLDPGYYTLIDDFEVRFPAPPSLVGCTALAVEGDVLFEPGSVFRGTVKVVSQAGTQRRLAPVHLDNEECVL